MLNVPTLICCLIAFTLTIDYSLSLISAQAYWVLMGGDKELSGLVFGLYDATTICITPLLAIYISKGGSYNKMFVLGLIINMMGNIFYGLAFYAESWIFILVGRIIAGLGATCVPLLMVFVADSMERDAQATAVGYIKYVAALSRMLGPLIGSLLTFTLDDDGIIGKLFNMYTFVGWIPILMDIIALILLCIYSSAFNKKDDGAYMHTSFQFCTIMKTFWPILLIGFLTTIIYWLFMGNAFIIATHHFHVINNEHELSRIYITGFVGFVAAFVLFMFGKKYMTGMPCLVGSLILLSIGSYMFLINDDWGFYCAVGITTFAYGLMIPSLNIINNEFGKNIKAIIGSYMALAISFIVIVQGAARFAGPAIFTLFTQLNENVDCDFKNPDQYITDGCNIENYFEQNVAYITVCSVFTFMGIAFLVKKSNEFKKNSSNQMNKLTNVSSR
jgi:MFS family permease